ARGRRGVAPARIHGTPNGADLPAPTPRAEGAPARYLLYFGALQPWQGLDTALRALARLHDDLADLARVLRASGRRRKAKPYRRLAARLGVEERVHWHFALPESELAPWREHAVAALARARERCRAPGAAARLLAQRRAGVRAAEGARVDGVGRAGRGLRPAGRAGAD